MDWIELNNIDQLEEISEKSMSHPVLIYKHSTRCSISTVVKNRLESGKLPESFDYYFLDLIKYRNISNEISDRFGVEHESPQVIIIKNGNADYHSSHFGISSKSILQNLTQRNI